MSKLKQSFLTIVIGLALAAGLSYAWTGPTANPPLSNASAPINVSGNEQGFVDNKTLKVKGGTGVLSLFGALKVNGIFQLVDGTQGLGKVLTSDAEGKASWGNGGGGALEHGKKLFTANGTFTVPSDVTKVWVSMSGGGGGGGGGQYCAGLDSSGGGGGGGAEAFIAKEIAVTSLENIAITIGVGGGGGVSDVNCENLKRHKGKAGGNSSFGSYLIANGGGETGTRTQPGNSGGQGGSSGQAGDGLAININAARLGGSGGGSIFGSGGNASYYNAGKDFCNSNSSCRDGSGYGGGGAGGRGSNDAGGENWTVTEEGGKGASGFVLVEW